MTLGQRIAQKRKEQGLSQEGLGERLGVSRQAIYKWESDASLPEIDKLITLSQIFSVSVGWLLGVEEDATPQREDSGELTETQLQMVQEIVDRYLAARPAPAPPKHQALARFCKGAAVGFLIVVLFNLFSKLDRMTQDYNSLYWSVNNVNSSVDRQIGSITSRVESILKSQNDLTAEWSTQLVSTDLAANTAAFDVRVVPRTYVEGMTALFLARSGEDTVEVPVEAGPDGAFSGQVTCPLTDDISLTVVFLTGGKRETQWLEDYGQLYSATFPDLSLFGWLRDEPPDENGVLLAAKANRVTVRELGDSGWLISGFRPELPATLRVGLFRDRKLLFWYEEREYDIHNGGVTDKKGYDWVRTQDVTLEPGHSYTEAMVYTDPFGRQRVYSNVGVIVQTDTSGNIITRQEAVYVDEADPGKWEY